ncbi:uncharacterized protein K460DRAFT_276992, partial [Cucurbitaria berberidis CBS 394.84]
LKIAFHRTLRVPEDGRTHKLPASFGRFPVQNVAVYSKKLINSKNASLLDMARKGGVFFPIFQREAMWLSFSSPAGSEYKVRVFVGGVNVVTGKKWDDHTKSNSPYDEDEQDYILVPPQEHVDGIAVGNGIVRQFIAMPIGSGYSIEKQITGKEDVGGLQLEITAQNRHLHFYYRGRDIKWQENEESGRTTTPRTYGLRAGETINMMPPTYSAVPSPYSSITTPPYQTQASPTTRPMSQPPPQSPQQEPKVESWAMGLAAGGRLAQQIHLDTTPSAYRDTTPSATALLSVQLLNAVAYETLTGMLCPPTPITAKEYTEAGIPWFDTYVDKGRYSSAVQGGKAFDKIQSVSEIDGRGGPIHADTSVAASQKVACSSCRRNLCDCVLRPCNHAFCGGCVKERMVQYLPANVSVVQCLVCRAIAANVLGFSAPMALPGQEEWLLNTGADVVVKAGCFGKAVVFELE